MITSLETYSLPKVNQEELANMSKQMASNETEPIIWKFFQ